MTVVVKKIGGWLKKNWFLVGLVIYAVAVRCLYPATGSFAFIFDHGKDSLNVMEMMVMGKPKLIGPWTSIPGLFFGPGWYYLLALAFGIGAFHPVAPVWLMVGLGVGQVYLMYRYFGKVAAAMVAGGSLWLTVTTSAWNPFPITLMSLLILIILSKIKQDGRWGGWRLFWLGFWASLGFHFSSAFAVFYIPILGIILGVNFWQRQKNKRWGKGAVAVGVKKLAVFLVGFLLPFLPQMVFELRHDFSETKAVINYFAAGGESGDGFSLARVREVWGKSLGEMRLAALPDINFGSGVVVGGWWIILGGLGINFIYRWWRGKIKLPGMFFESAVMIVVPMIGFSFLHFNLWYLLGLMPAVVIIVSGVVEAQAKGWRVLWIVAVLLGGVSVNWRDFGAGVMEQAEFYSQGEKVWQEIKRLGAGKNYAVYTYRPDIYDFNFQYLILRDGLVNDYPVPVEFSYAASESAYVPSKELLLSRVARQEGEAEMVFYILTRPDRESDSFLQWQGRNANFLQAEMVQEVGEGLQLWRWNNR